MGTLLIAVRRDGEVGGGFTKTGSRYQERSPKRRWRVFSRVRALMGESIAMPASNWLMPGSKRFMIRQT